MNEKLSALMDGELSRDEAEVVIKTLGNDPVRRLVIPQVRLAA